MARPVRTTSFRECQRERRSDQRLQDTAAVLVQLVTPAPTCRSSRSMQKVRTNQFQHDEHRFSQRGGPSSL